MKRKKLFADIELYLPFAVPAATQSEARALVRRYRNNEMVLRLLHDYYTALPDAREEAAVRVALFSARQGVHFLVLSTTDHHWLYAVSPESVALAGEYGVQAEQLPMDVVRFLGFSSRREYESKAPPVEELEEVEGDTEVVCCPACGVLEGEEHLPGCTVEVCPWCDGQLSSCNCRFEKLGVEEIESEEQVAEFMELLEEKGRIPFAKEQAPAYPGTSRGLDEGPEDAT